MSLLITTHMVSEVLLNDGWHTVDEQTFDIDEYEFIAQVSGPEGEEGQMLHTAGQAGVCAVGFTFLSDGVRISGPLTAIHALKDSARSTLERIPQAYA